MNLGFGAAIRAFLQQIVPRPMALLKSSETSSRTIKLPGYAVALAVALSACDLSGDPSADTYPWLDTLDAANGAKASGRRLMSIDAGLSRVDRDGDSTLLIGVHGYQSEGYEWVRPLQVLDDDTNEVHFFRWDWNRCPSDAAAELDAAIESLLNARPTIRRVVLIGHSLGGLVVAEAAYTWQRDAPLEAHVIASPLQRIGANDRCPGLPLSDRSLAPNSSFAQWRTRQELDGAFKDLTRDPQVVALDRSNVTRLPETYRGHRLGHNWSVSWVAETIAGDPPPP
jgi:pimeloyl-ACP methyl ester carboxylesterase